MDRGHHVDSKAPNVGLLMTMLHEVVCMDGGFKSQTIVGWILFFTFIFNIFFEEKCYTKYEITGLYTLSTHLLGTCMVTNLHLSTQFGYP